MKPCCRVTAGRGKGREGRVAIGSLVMGISRSTRIRTRTSSSSGRGTACSSSSSRAPSGGKGMRKGMRNGHKALAVAAALGSPSARHSRLFLRGT